MNPKNRQRLFFIPVALLALLVGPTQRCLAQVLYAVDGAGMAASSNLYTVDPSNGLILSNLGTVMLSGSPVPISAIAFNPTTGVLFGTTNANNTTRLVTINLLTAQAASVGTVGFSMQGIAFGPSGALFGYSKAGVTGNPSFPKESLYSINASSGAPVLIGSSGFANTQGDGMAIDAAGQIYLSGTQSAGQLSVLSSSTGAATPYANLTGGPSISAPIKGLTFDSAGLLLGIYNGGTTDLLSIGTVPVGGNVSIMDRGTFSPATPSVLTGLAFQPVPEPSSITLLMIGACAALMRKRNGRVARPERQRCEAF